MKKILVTGITGKSGSFFLEELIKNYAYLKEYQFRFFVRPSSKTNKIIEAQKFLKIEIFKGDLQNDNDIKNFFNGEYDTLFHIMGINYSLPLINEAIKNNIKRCILVHTTGVYSKYKAAGENYRKIDSEVTLLCNKNNISLTILRPTMIYGNLQDHNLSVFIKMVDKLRIFPVVNGAKYELQPVWCGDLGKAYYQVLINENSTKNKNYNLSGGKPITLLAMFKVIGAQLDVKNKFISIPFNFAYIGAWILYICTFSKIDFREKVQRLVEPRTFEHIDAYNDFGYSPLNFEDGIIHEIQAYKNTTRK